jgi:hypothetical protein
MNRFDGYVKRIASIKYIKPVSMTTSKSVGVIGPLPKRKALRVSDQKKGCCNKKVVIFSHVGKRKGDALIDVMLPPECSLRFVHAHVPVSPPRH